MKKLLLLTSLIILASCSSKLLVPTETDAARSASMFENSNLESLTEGRMLYKENCSLCHDLHLPNEFSEEKWTKVVPIMSNKVNQKLGKTQLDDSKQDLILQYLLTMRTASK